MKAIELEGTGGQVAIDMEFSPWSSRVHTWRTEGDEGKTVLFGPAKDPASWAAANAKIAELEAQGEQGRIFKHDPRRAVAPVAELAGPPKVGVDVTRKPGRPSSGK